MCPACYNRWQRHGDCEYIRKKKTNADRVHSMSVEGLADLFAKIEHADPENHLGKDGWLVWLKMEGKS